MAAADGARARREGEVLHLEGRLDRAAAVALWPTLQALADGARALELGAIQALDSAGLALLAEAAGRSGREALGHLARAEHQQLTGRITDAIRQLGVARRVAERAGDTAATARIEQRYEAFLGYRETLEEFQ